MQKSNSTCKRTTVMHHHILCYSDRVQVPLWMPESDTIVENYGGQNNNNLMIRFLNMIKEGGLFGTYTFTSILRPSQGMKVIYQKQMSLTLRSSVKF